MRTLCRTAVALAVFALAANVALAQKVQVKKVQIKEVQIKNAQNAQGQKVQFVGGFGRGMADPSILVLNKMVQKDLGLSEEQVKKVQTVRREVYGKFRGEYAKLKDLEKEERAKKSREIRAKIGAASTKIIAGIINEKQMARLNQIVNQQKGLADAGIQKALKLSDEQIGKLKSLQETFQKNRTQAFQDARTNKNFKGFREKLEKLTKEANDKKTAVLTDSQKEAWQEMTGKWINISRGFGAIRPAQGGVKPNIQLRKVNPNKVKPNNAKPNQVKPNKIQIKVRPGIQLKNVKPKPVKE